MQTEEKTTDTVYRPTIGIEVHAELKTKTKMFCDSANAPHTGEPNTHICPVCLAHPGTLPVINKEAVKHVLKVGLALGSELASYTEFDRKNYFYPDIPKGYQISQYIYPLVKGGVLEGVAITRVHLEEDTARSQHESGEGSLIDYNRAGVPLMELVTEPVIHSAKDAANFARELQLLLRTLGVSDANMEQGEMRVEANISISSTDTFGTKVEVKNLNSFKSVESAIIYEIDRQKELLEKGEMVVQETRGWDEIKSRTFSQRLKETAHEYRYFPDPDLPKLDLTSYSEFSVSRLQQEIPLLPSILREKYSYLGLTREHIEIIIADTVLRVFFAAVLLHTNDNQKLATLSANYLTSDIGQLRMNGLVLNPSRSEAFVSLMKMVEEGKITSRVAKDLLLEVLESEVNPQDLAESRGLLQNNSSDALRVVVLEVIALNESVVLEYRAGKITSLQFLVGQGMKATKGSANPTLLAELFVAELQ